MSLTIPQAPWPLPAVEGDSERFHGNSFGSFKDWVRISTL